MPIKARVGRTYTEYQVEKMIKNIEEDYEQQWNDRLEEIQNKTFEQVKADMWSQFMGVAMAALEQFNDFKEEQLKKFYNDCECVLAIMENNVLGNKYTPQDAIDHVKEKTGIDLDNK